MFYLKSLINDHVNKITNNFSFTFKIHSWKCVWAYNMKLNWSNINIIVTFSQEKVFDVDQRASEC